MKSAVIVGCNGQDGRIIFEQLAQKGYKLLGIDIGIIRKEGINWNMPVDIGKIEDVYKVLQSIRPDEIYYLAAFHHSSEDKLIDDIKFVHKSYEVNVFSLVNFLEGIRKYSPKTKLFYAASALIFGNTKSEVQDEDTPFCPDTIYGITKLSGLQLCRYYRNCHHVFAAVGILYNHESIYRSDNFLSAKVIKGALAIYRGQQIKITIGDLKAEVDWGYAPDYTRAMYEILKMKKADDYIIASGEKHSVQEFVERIFDCLGQSWRDYIVENKNGIARSRRAMVGNPKKLIETTGWRPSVNFSQMVRLLLQEQGGQFK